MAAAGLVAAEELDVAALRRAVKEDAALARKLGEDQTLINRLAHLAEPPSPSSPSIELEPSCLSASWILCALGIPPSANAPRGAIGSKAAKASLANMLAAHVGRGRRPEQGVRILSLDGGGTRALVTIEMLKELEKQTGQRIHELFDVIAGTSTGGILAAGIQERLSLNELEELYLELAALVFTREAAPRRGFQLLLTGGTYKAHKLEAILKRVLPRLSPAEEVAAALAFDGIGATAEPADQSVTMLERRALQEAMYAAERPRAVGSRSRSPSPPPREMNQI